MRDSFRFYAGVVAALVVCFNTRGVHLRADEVGLEHILVTDKRTESSYGSSPEQVVVIDAKEIAGLPARNISEVLDYANGVAVQQTGGFGKASAVSIQGSDSRHVRVMVDGIPFNTQSSGQVNLSQFSVDNIERIEIVKGSASSVWGSGLGGVINIITKKPVDSAVPSGSVTKSWAEFNTNKENVQVSSRQGAAGYYLVADHMESAGRGRHDDVLEKKGFSKFSYDMRDWGNLTCIFGYNGADINTGVFPDGTWQAQPYRTQYGKVGWEHKDDRLSLNADLKHSRQTVVTRFFGLPEDDASQFEVQSRDLLYQLSLGAGWKSENGLLVNGGIDSDYDVVKSNVYLSTAKHVTTQAPYAACTIPVDAWDFTAAARYDHNSEYGGEASPSLGAVYHCPGTKDAIVKVTAAHTFSAPPLLWRFNSEPALGVAPNPDLKPERAWVYETGYESTIVSTLRGSLSVYRADVRDAISRADNGAGLTMMKNFERFRRQGVEAVLRYKLGSAWEFSGSGAFNNIEDRQTHEIVQGGGRPRQVFDLGIIYRHPVGLHLSLHGYYNYWNEPALSEPNDRKMLFDLAITQEWRYLSLFLNVYNLGNSRYWEDIFFPTPMRYVEGGVTVKW